MIIHNKYTGTLILLFHDYLFRLLDKHIFNVHLNREVCDKCGKDFGGGLAGHKEICGVPKKLTKRYQCEVCDHACRAASSLKSQSLNL